MWLDELTVPTWPRLLTGTLSIRPNKRIKAQAKIKAFNPGLQITVPIKKLFHFFLNYNMWVLKITVSNIFLTSQPKDTQSTCLNWQIRKSVTCLATDACLTADPGVASLIPVQSHTFIEIDHEMISTVMKWFLRSFSSLPLIHSRRVVVSYKRKYVHELLVNRLFKPAQEKVWLGELTVPQWL